jgi:hypothetical protein
VRWNNSIIFISIIILLHACFPAGFKFEYFERGVEALASSKCIERKAGNRKHSTCHYAIFLPGLNKYFSIRKKQVSFYVKFIRKEGCLNYKKTGNKQVDTKLQKVMLLHSLLCCYMVTVLIWDHHKSKRYEMTQQNKVRQNLEHA